MAASMRQIKEESKKRLRRQWDLLVKRADVWFRECEQPPNFVMMVLRGDRVEWKAPDHMSAFANSPPVVDKFKEVSLGRLYMPSQRNDVARQTEEPLALPYADSSVYSWDMLVFIIPAILRRNGIYGKAAYRPENRPSWWPRDVRFCSPNSDTQENKRLSVAEMQMALESFLQQCRNEYAIVHEVDNAAATCQGHMMEEDGEIEHPAFSHQIHQEKDPVEQLGTPCQCHMEEEADVENHQMEEVSQLPPYALNHHADEVEQQAPTFSCQEQKAADQFSVPSQGDQEEEVEVEHPALAIALDVWQKRFKQIILVLLCEKIKIFTKTILFTKDQVPDEIIDAYMYSLLRDTRSEYQYIPCSVMSLMLNRKHQCKVADVEVAAESIIGLFNMGRRHWILVIISASARRMTVLNPLGEVDESLTGLLSTLKSFLANNPTNFSLTLGPNWEVVTIPHSKQPDSTSCGIFCLKFAEKLLKQEELLLPSQPNDIFQYRLDILESIAKNQDSTIKELCRCCGCKMPPGKEKRVQWIGCDQCGDFWIHYQCMKTNDSYKAVSASRYVCVFCQI